MHLKRLAMGLFTASLLLFSFQNCSGGFQTQQLDTNSSIAGSMLSVPQIAFTVDVPDTVNTDSLTAKFTVSSAEQLQSVRCQLNSNPAQDCSSLSVTYNNLADGDYILQITATNKSGSSAQEKRVFRKDSQAPAVAFSNGPPAVTALITAQIAFSATDNLSGIKSIECALDAAAFAACTSPVNLSGLSMGSHIFKVRATDKANNLSAVSSYTWTVNLTAPTVTITQTPASVTNSTSANFVFSGVDIVSYECALDNAAFAACASPKALTGLSATAHTFQVRGTSNAAVVSMVHSYSWTIDTTVPATPSLLANVTSPTKLAAASFNFSSTDASGIASYQCLIDTAVYAACSSPKALSALASGSHTIKVKAVDNAGNSSAEVSFVWVVDTVAPSLSFTQNPLASTTATTAAFAFTVADSGSGLNLVQCSLDNAAFADCTSPTSSTVAVGMHSYRVQAQDKALNSTLITYNWTVTAAGTQPPVVNPPVMTLAPYIDPAKIPAPNSNVFTTERRQKVPDDPAFLPTQQDGGAFREPCKYSHFGFNDPIVFPGQAGKSHLHVFFGNSTADEKLTVDNVLQAPGSTCAGGTLNRSSYWAPAMIDTTTNAPLVPSDMTVYYKHGFGDIKPNQLKEVPNGLRMISGNSKSAGEQGGVIYTCFDVGPDLYNWHTSIPNCVNGARLVAAVDFPQCWDGVNLDSPDHKSHMHNTVDGLCPASHPVALPMISFQVIYKIDKDYKPGQLRLSSDNYDPTLPAGYSGHADYFMGWNPDIVKVWTKFCLGAAMDCHSYMLGDGTMLFD